MTLPDVARETALTRDGIEDHRGRGLVPRVRQRPIRTLEKTWADHDQSAALIIAGARLVGAGAPRSRARDERHRLRRQRACAAADPHAPTWGVGRCYGPRHAARDRA